MCWSSHGARTYGGTPLRLDFYEHGIRFNPRVRVLTWLLPTVELLYSEVGFVYAISLPLAYFAFSGAGVRMSAPALEVSAPIVFLTGAWLELLNVFERCGVSVRKEPVKLGVWTIG